MIALCYAMSFSPAKAEEAGALCDRLAAGSVDQALPPGVVPVLGKNIDKTKAVPACEKAVAGRPDIVRFLYQLGRAYQAADRDSEAFAAFEKAATAGYTAAFGNLGYCYEFGNGTQVDLDKALENYQKGASLGLKFGHRRAGLLYQKASFARQDYVKAAAHFQAASDLGDGDATGRLGVAYLRGYGVKRDYAKAMQLFKKADDLGATEAADYLGWMYENGYGALHDRREARRWYLRGRSRGDTYAAVHLGNLELNDLDKRNAVKAFAYYQEAANKREAQGMYGLGYVYAEGIGVPQNYRMARIWYEKGGAQGSSDALDNLGALYEAGRQDPPYSKPNYARALEYYLAAAQKGDRYAMNNVAYILEKGLADAKPDLTRAMVWYENAAYLGHNAAMRRLADIYSSDTMGKKDLILSFDWYLRAASNANAIAMVNVGWAHENGLGTKINYAQALEWYKKAAELGNSDGMNNVGVIYSQGRGVRTDNDRAIEWFTKAVETDGHSLAHFNLAIFFRDGLGTPPSQKQAASHMLKALSAHDETAFAEMRDNAAYWPKEFWRSLQTDLKKDGLYGGAIDGTRNKFTMDAIEHLYRAQ